MQDDDRTHNSQQLEVSKIHNKASQHSALRILVFVHRSVVLFCHNSATVDTPVHCKGARSAMPLPEVLAVMFAVVVALALQATVAPNLRSGACID